MIRQNLKAVEVPLRNLADGVELVAVDIFAAKSFRLICTYRPPQFSLDQTVQLCLILDNLIQTTTLPIILVGDFNFPAIDWARTDGG